MSIREYIRFNKDIKETLFSCLALSYGFLGSLSYLNSMGMELYRSSNLTDLEKNISEAKNPLLFINIFDLINDFEEE